MTTITIAGERAPGWNKAIRMHWSKWRELVRITGWRMLPALPANTQLLDYPVDVHVIATYKGMALDSDNICAKLYIDALKGRLLRDDDARYVRRVTTEAHKGKANSVQIVIERAGE